MFPGNVDTTSIKMPPSATIQMHFPLTNLIDSPKKYQKIALKAPKPTGVVFLHPPAILNAIGVIKST
jgi:hypothetical protein